MGLLLDVKRAVAKTNSYIHDNNSSLIDLLLLLVTPLVAVDVLRQLFPVGGVVWIVMTFSYLTFYMLIPTLWLRSTVESKDPERDFISYLGSAKTFLTALILIIITLIFFKIPEAAQALDQKHNLSFDYTQEVIFIIFSIFCARLSFIIPLYNSGLELSYKQAMEATRGKVTILILTVIVSALPLLIFTVAYLFFIEPWIINQFFNEMETKVITMILQAPALYIAIPMIFIYSFTALAYHYANYARQYLMDEKNKG